MDWHITGHKQQLELLGKAVQNGQLAHAYLFAGPKGVGKLTTARRLGQMLLAASPTTESDFHPDYAEIIPDGEIKIAQIRELVYKLSLKPYSAPYKVAVIDEAHEMNTEAANALLKSLEEPKPNTVIILVTSNPARLPKTIVSRTQKITFGALTPAERSRLPVEQNEDAAARQALAREYYQKVFQANLGEKLVLAQELADWETPDLKLLFEIWLGNLRENLHAEPSLNLVQKLRAVSGAGNLLDQNINSKLLLANLMLKL